MTQGTCHARSGETAGQVAAGKAGSGREVRAPRPASVRPSVRPCLCSASPMPPDGRPRHADSSACLASWLLRAAAPRSAVRSRRTEEASVSQGPPASTLRGSDWLTRLSLNQSLRPSESSLHRWLRTGQHPAQPRLCTGRTEATAARRALPCALASRAVAHAWSPGPPACTESAGQLIFLVPVADFSLLASSQPCLVFVGL